MHRRFQISIFKSLLKLPFGVESPPALRPFSVAIAANAAAESVFRSSAAPSPARPFGSDVGRVVPCLPGSRSSRRGISSEAGNGPAGEVARDEVVDLINVKFAEAREEIEMAMESKETVYYDEEAECARAAVKEVLDLFDGLLAKLPEGERAALQRSMGLKMEQLKAELNQLED